MIRNKRWMAAGVLTAAMLFGCKGSAPEETSAESVADPKVTTEAVTEVTTEAVASTVVSTEGITTAASTEKVTTNESTEAVTMPEPTETTVAPTERQAQVRRLTTDEVRNTEVVRLQDSYTQTEERPLLVLLMGYPQSMYEYDEEYEKAWSDYIFGTGTTSGNDNFQEISGGKFKFTPVLLGDNTTGVYTFHMDKDYSYDQGVHPEYSYFEFNYDMALCISKLKEQGLDIGAFAVDDINNANYVDKLFEYAELGPTGVPKEYYKKAALMCVFPEQVMEKVDLTPISDSFDKFCLYAYINETSSFGTICHELGHLMGAFDVYKYGDYYNDLMARGADISEAEYSVTHIDPYYKLLYGWCDADLLESDGAYQLYAPSTGEYRPLLIPTEDPNQYFLVEYRTPTGFDSELNKLGSGGRKMDGGLGVTIWRVDQTALHMRQAELTYVDDRKGISMEGTLEKNIPIELMYYKDYTDPKSTELTSANIKLTVLSGNEEETCWIEIKRTR